MILEDPETRQPRGQETLDLIKSRLEEYRLQIKSKQQRESPSHFQNIERKLIMQKGKVSKEELIASYIEEVKKDLIRNLGEEIVDNKSDTSMATSSKGENPYACLAGESQDPDEDIPSTEDIFDALKDTLLDNIRKKTGESSNSKQE